MAQYIDKTALVAEIESLRRTSFTNFDEGVNAAVQTLLEALDTLEVKEIGVDLGDPQGDIGVKEVKEEPVSNDLEEAACEYDNSHIDDNNLSFKAGAQWQKEQMEKNRIEHCDNITEEQYNLETGFLDDFLDKNKRMPTFLDAIEYGMKKAQKGE